MTPCYKCGLNSLFEWRAFLSEHYFLFYFILNNRSCNIWTSIGAPYSYSYCLFISYPLLSAVIALFGVGRLFQLIFQQMFSQVRLHSLQFLSHVIFCFEELLRLCESDLSCLPVLLVPFAISFSKGYGYNSSILGREGETFETDAALLQSIRRKQH